MNIKIFLSKILRILIWAVCILAVLAACSGIAVNIILNENTLLGLVRKYAPEYISGELSVKGADVSVFSSFPYLEVRLDSICLKDKSADTLISADRCELAVNAGLYLSRGALGIPRLEIIRPDIRYVRSASGKCGWDDILIAGTPEDSNKDAPAFSAAGIRKFEIRGADIAFTDSIAGISVSVTDGNVGMKGGIGKNAAAATASVSAEKVSIRSGQYLRIKERPLEMEGKIMFRNDSLSFKDMHIRSGAIALSSHGTVDFGTPSQADTDIEYSIDINSLSDILGLIPETIVPESHNARVKGSVSCSGSLRGTYAKDTFPVAEGRFVIRDGAFSYKGMGASIDTVQLEMEYLADLKDKSRSKVVIDTMIVSGNGIKLHASGKFTDIIDNPRIRVRVDGNADLNGLTEIFPFAEGVTMNGRLVLDKLVTRFDMKAITDGDYGKIRSRGRFHLEDIDIVFPEDSVSIRVVSANGNLGSNTRNRNTVQGTDLLKGKISVDSALISLPGGQRIFTDSLYTSFSTSPLKDTSHIASVTAEGYVGKTTVHVRDTLFVGLRSLSIKSGLSPYGKDKKIPQIHAIAKIDSLRGRYIQNRIGLDSMDIDLTLTRLSKTAEQKVWVISGHMELERLRVFTPVFPIRMVSDSTRLEFDRSGIHLTGASFRIGRSDIFLSGDIDNLWRGIYKKEKIFASMNVESRHINFNQIMRASDMGQKYLSDEALQRQVSELGDNIDNTTDIQITDTSAVRIGRRLFAVPSWIDFTFNSSIKEFIAGNLTIRDFKGNILMRNGSLHISELSFGSDAVDGVRGKAIYSCSSSDKGYVGMELDLHNVIIDSIVTAAPSLDSLVPMLSSLKGNVDFYIAAETDLDRQMNPVMSSLRSGIHLEGRNLTLLDGETFAEIAKMLKFQNRRRNIIDSIAVNLSIEDNILSVYPFVMSIDRYFIAAGGEQKIDGNFNYHISLLESPVVFKVGVDITGKDDKMKYKITKARYKDIRQATRKSKIDSTAFEINFRMLDMIRDKRNTAPEEPLI